MGDPVQSRRERPCVQAGRLVALLVALAGLFAMHGLSDHGASGRLEAAGASMVMAHGTMLTGAVLAGHDAGGLGPPAASGLSSDGHEMGMAGMCLAVLAVVLLLIPTRSWRSLAGSLWAVGERSVAAVSHALARSPDPPDLILLSIHRC